ncbi:hemerythrin domain-containing protein [Candidatus Obscuribacterales bacterium]|nr:hemerythrin domain-containing protein [Candidatus Obscuribacterales bacterium]
MLTRRSFVGLVAGFSAGMLPALAANSKKDSAMNEKESEHEEEVTPAEDLMREHGALNRMLLIYDKARDSLSNEKQFPRDVIVSTAMLIRKFIEEYHEKLEEDHLFPRFKKAGKLVDLVDTLKSQHEAGRKLTATILTITESDTSYSSKRVELIKGLSDFVKMYRPHEAREDTVLFPALRSIISEREYKSLGEQFEEKEHKLFGQGGFTNIVEQIADLEKKIGIYDLNQFTP